MESGTHEFVAKEIENWFGLKDTILNQSIGVDSVKVICGWLALNLETFERPNNGFLTAEPLDDSFGAHLYDSTSNHR